jgi:hypothetical protein
MGRLPRLVARHVRELDTPSASGLAADPTAQTVTIADRRGDARRRPPRIMVALLPLCLTGCWSGHSSDTFSFGVDDHPRLADKVSIERGIADDISSHLTPGTATTVSCPGSQMERGQTYSCAGVGYGIRVTIEVSMGGNSGEYTWRVSRKGWPSQHL